MSSTPKKRLKSVTKTKHTPLLMEPPKSLFPSKEETLKLLAVLVIASIVALACNIFNNFIGSSPKPFCDTRSDAIDYSLSDSCEPCPSNGECYQGQLECDHGYRKHINLCVEDGEMNETAKKLVEVVESNVCEGYAQLLCNGSGTIWVQEADIWKDLDRYEQTHDNATYLYTKRRIMEIVGQSLETSTNSNGIKELKCPDFLVERYKPFKCRIRQWVLKHGVIIVTAFASLLGCALLLWKVRRRRYLASRVEELYHQVCDILEENALACKNEPWVVASRLRDHILLPRERKEPLIWKKVEELVQEDSRVDRYPRLVKGESKVVWEWQVEGSLSASKLRKKEEARKDENINVDWKHYSDSEVKFEKSK